MRRVVIESPLAGDIAANIAYAKRCMLDSLRRGEAPFASHLLYAQADLLDDTVVDERALGIAAGLAWGAVAELAAVYVDRGITKGMLQGVLAHRRRGVPIVCRVLDVPGGSLDVDANGYLCTCAPCASVTADPHRELICAEPSLRADPADGGLLHDERLLQQESR